MRDQGRLLWILLTAAMLPYGCRHPLVDERTAGPKTAALSKQVRPVESADAPVELRLAGEQTASSTHAELASDPSIRLVEYITDDPAERPADNPADVPAERLPAASEDAPAEVVPAVPAILILRDVVMSVYTSYPLLEIGRLEGQVTEGKELAAWGEFDTSLKGFAISQPMGYYQNYRNGVAVTQPMLGGGYAYSGYKIGRGDIEPWYRERETNNAGEFAVGVGMPLLKDRAIDKRRSAVSQAALAREAVEPEVQAQLLDYVRVASQIYWSWVAAGQALEAQRELLRLAQSRVNQIEERVKIGDLERIVRLNNRQLIASREAKVIEADRKLQAAAIKLSLFYRTPQGEPLVAEARLLPLGFPSPVQPDSDRIDEDIAAALQVRPEFRALDLLVEQLSIELTQTENSLLPKLDATVLAAKDAGAWADAKGDKTPFQLEAGLYGEVPLQRREAAGKIVAVRGKLEQVRTKREYVGNKVAAEVQDAFSAMHAAAERTERAKENLDLAGETMALGELAFDSGDIDLISLNIYEQTRTDAQFQWIEAQADFFIAQADYHAAMGLDPLAE
jgi:outer membrane protein TolC